ncbi:MAG: 5'-methylthioadenosine/adenosylhomocysteine nucleosidase [Ruminococcus sp.]|jgi:adenosylhomocysteine nucleosidase|nr:5'-methylthioadenosine/adenosylhomocysteine nucleosidase [Ruminococcus sp.]
MKTIGIVAAMPSEVADIRKELGEAKVEKQGKIEFYVWEKDGVKIVNVLSGIAKVNAAVATAMLISRYEPDFVVNCGVAGGMNSEIKVLDIVISNTVMPHDLDLHFLKDYPPYCCEFKSDGELIEKVDSICKEMGINTFIGPIVSGEVFLEDPVRKAEITEKFSPYAVDMETAAVGHCCYLYGVPFVSVRCISDNADDEAGMSFDEFVPKAAKRVADVVLTLANA